MRSESQKIVSRSSGKDNFKKRLANDRFKAQMGMASLRNQSGKNGWCLVKRDKTGSKRNTYT